MKLVAAIVLVLSHVSLRSCRTRHSISLLQDGRSSEVTLVAPHKVPTIAQLIPILEGIDPPETKISKLKKLIPIYDELNRWRLNNKKRLVEIIPLKNKVKPLAFILPGSSSYVNKLKTTDGSDEDSDQATVESSSRGEVIRQNTKHQPQTEKHTHKDGHTSTNKHKSHNTQHSHSSHNSNSHTRKTDSSASHTTSEEDKSENSATEHNLSLQNVEKLPEDVSGSDSNESSYGSKEFDSNESESESNEPGSSVPESNESNSGLNPDLEIREIDSGYSSSKSNEIDSNYKSNEAIIDSEFDSEPNETALESILSYIDLDSSKSDLETNTESSESSVSINSSKSEFNDESSKMDYDSEFNVSFLMPSDYNSNSNSDYESSGENSESVAPDAVLSSESYSESDSNSELNNSLSQSESAESEITDSESSQSVSESIEGTTNVITKIDDTADSSQAEESQVGTRRLMKHHENDDEEESIDTTLKDQPDKNYDYFFNFNDDNAIDETADTTQMVNRFHGNYNDVEEFEIENTNIVKQNHEIGGESNDNGQSNEINEPIVAVRHVTHQINGSNKDAPEDGDDSKPAVPINTTHATKKQQETTTHINKQHHKNVNQELDEESTKLIPKKHHEHKHHGYDDTVIASKLISNHQNYDFEETNEPRDDSKPIDNKHHGKHITNHQHYGYEETNEYGKSIDNKNYGDYDKYQSVVLSKHNKNYNDVSNEADDAVAAMRMANIHHESIDNNYYNDDESKLDDFTDYSSDDDQLTEDNEFYDDTESNKAAEANETNDSVAPMKINGRHPEIDHVVTSITYTAKTQHEFDDNEPKNGKVFNDYGSIEEDLLETDDSVAATNHNDKKHQEDGDNESTKDEKANADGSDVSNYVNKSKNEADTYYKTNYDTYNDTDNELGDKETLKRVELVAATKQITKNYDDSESDHLSRQIIKNYDDSKAKNAWYYEDESNEKLIKSFNHVQNPHKVDEPVFTRRMSTEHNVKVNTQSELCNILRGGSLPKKGVRQEKKKYILSFIFNR